MTTRLLAHERLRNLNVPRRDTVELFPPLTRSQRSNAARWVVSAAIVFIVTVVVLRAWFA